MFIQRNTSVMEWRIFLLLFLTGVQSQLVPRRFYLIRPGKTWSDALTYCRTYYTDMATSRNDEDFALIQAEAVKQKLTSDGWLGLSVDLDSWKWSLGNESVTSTGISHWASSKNEPSNTGGHEECAAMSPFGWWDLDCLSTLTFVCFDERNTGSAKYILYTNLLSWPDAQSYCRQYHTDLASTRDETEYSTVFGKSTNTFWIGLFRDSWRWVDNTPPNITWWYPQQPNGGIESCACLCSAKLIADWTCDNIVPFFCYREITGQQRIIRFKVQSDHGVNDPAVLAALVQKIKDKLKTHNLEKDISVKWRQQRGEDILKIINT